MAEREWGPQGDGSAQFIARSAADQERLVEIFETSMGAACPVADNSAESQSDSAFANNKRRDGLTASAFQIDKNLDETWTKTVRAW